MNKLSPKFVGFLQALGIVAYVVIFVSLVQIVPRDAELGPVAAPMFFLLAFVTSALLCGSIVFLYPVMLFSGGKRREAAGVVLWTAGWLMLALAVSAVAVIILVN